MKRCLSFLSLLAIATGAVPPRHRGLSSPINKLSADSNRLLSEVVPTAYTLGFRFEEDFAETSIFSGTVTITFGITGISTEDSSFPFHARGLNLTSTVLKQGSKVIDAQFSEPDEETDFVTVTPTDKLEDGDYSLAIEFNGFLSNTSMVGLYRSSYVDDFGQTQHVVATQFEEIHARKAFPCFDEPEMKAAFTLSVTYPKTYTAWSNTVSGSPRNDATNPNLQTVRFLKTPVMSTYLVALVMAPYYCKNGDLFNDKVAVQLCSRIGAADQSAKTALDATPHLLKYMSDFTNYTYNLNTLTLAAIPDFAPGAMENWGLITFREIDLLWYQDESSNYYQQKVLTSLAHELSHQWFGDLVTLYWWSAMFLNEGFATYFEYHAADAEHPEWQLTKQFVIDQLQAALELDSDDSVLPLVFDASDPDYGSRTNDVSYNKGASILRMLHHYLTLDKFKQGLADYIKQKSLSTATPDDLWNALQPYTADTVLQEGVTVSAIMESWTQKPGYPLLTVEASGKDIIISQEPFTIFGSGDTRWYVPITYTTSKDVSDFANTKTKEALTPSTNLTISGVLDGADWVILNNQQVGYYRVNYDNSLLDKISQALKSNVTMIDEISRAQIIDDQFNLAKAGKRKLSEVLSFLSFLRDDDSYFSWSSAFRGFDYLLQRTSDKEVRKELMKLVLALIQTLYDSVSLDEENPDDHLYTLKQVLSLTWACKLGDDKCVTTSRQKFIDYDTDATKKPPANLRSIVYCNGLRQSDNALQEFQNLWTKYTTTKIPSEKLTILQSLGCVNNAETRKMYLTYTLSEDQIRLQDAKSVFSSVYSNNPEGVTEVLEFAMDYHVNIIERFGDSSILRYLITTLSNLVTTDEQIAKLTLFGNIVDLDDDVKSSVANAITVAARNVNITTGLEKTLKSYLKISNGAGVIKGSQLLNIFIVGYILLNYFIY